jgi:hypothetical protein
MPNPLYMPSPSMGEGTGEGERWEFLSMPFKKDHK